MWGEVNGKSSFGINLGVFLSLRIKNTSWRRDDKWRVPPQYRTREAFLLFLIEKKKQSFIRQLEKAQKSLENLEKGIVLGNITLESLLKENQKQEANKWLYLNKCCFDFTKPCRFPSKPARFSSDYLRFTTYRFEKYFYLTVM